MPTSRVAARVWSLALDFLYPPRCGGCDRRGVLFCEECRDSISPAPQSSVAGVSRLVTVGAFDGRLREAIHNFKYNSDRPLAEPLAALLAERLRQLPIGRMSPALAAVPLHHAKERARGYNQSALLAKELGERLGWGVTQGLAREKATRSQVRLSFEERRENVTGAFVWRPEEAPPECVVLVDDVCTTGATLSDCARALRARGTQVVYAATVARALYAAPDAPF